MRLWGALPSLSRTGGPAGQVHGSQRGKVNDGSPSHTGPDVGNNINWEGLQVRKNSFGARAIRDFKKNYEIYLILLPVVAFYLIFSYADETFLLEKIFESNSIFSTLKIIV